jgi:hypothetical protein
VDDSSFNALFWRRGRSFDYAAQCEAARETSLADARQELETALRTGALTVDDLTEHKQPKSVTRVAEYRRSRCVSTQELFEGPKFK